MKYQLRPYQRNAVNELWQRFRRGAKAPLIVAPTGAGKTVIACSIIEEIMKRHRILFLAHRTELIKQCSDKLKEIGIVHGVIKAGLDSGSHYDRVQVASVQTFKSRIQYMRKDYPLIIIDEAHHAAAETYGDIIKHCGSPNIIGLTATPYRTDGAPLESIFDDMLSVTDTASLIKDGFLVPPRNFIGQMKLDLFGVHTKAGDYDADELAEKMKKPRLTGHAINEYLRLARGLRGVAFCCNIIHSKSVCEAFNLAGITAEHLDALTPAKQRSGILERLRNGKTKIVTNCAVLTEGWDEPKIEAIIALRPTQSRCLWRQMIGRGLRICPQIHKRYCMVLDHAGWQQEHGNVTDPDIISLAGGLEKEKRNPSIKTCERCGAMIIDPKVIRCPECGCKIEKKGTGGFHPGLGNPNFELHESTPFIDSKINFQIVKPQQQSQYKGRIMFRKKGLETI